MHMEHLLLEVLFIWGIGAAATISPVICHHDHLEHVVVERKGHLIEGPNVSIKCRDCEDIGSISKVSGEC